MPRLVPINLYHFSRRNLLQKKLLEKETHSNGGSKWDLFATERAAMWVWWVCSKQSIIVLPVSLTASLCAFEVLDRKLNDYLDPPPLRMLPIHFYWTWGTWLCTNSMCDSVSFTFSMGWDKQNHALYRYVVLMHVVLSYELYVWASHVLIDMDKAILLVLSLLGKICVKVTYSESCGVV